MTDQTYLDSFKQTDATKLTIAETRELVQWANDFMESYWDNPRHGKMPLQGILNLYQASSEYYDFDVWMSDTEGAFDLWLEQFKLGAKS